jgi:phytanoyl-CoA hydroxylase
MPLTPQQLAQFHDDGFVVVKGLVKAAALDLLKTEIEALHERMAAAPTPGVGVSWEENLPAGHAPRIRQLMHSERVSPLIEQLLGSDTMLDIIEQLIGPKIILYHSKLMMKAARDGSFTPWHQDWGYWQHHSIKASQVNCMLSIDPAAEDNGCIRFVPGSHKAGPVAHSRFQSSSFNIGLPGGLEAYPTAVPVATEAGDAVFFGSLVIHGSAPNESGRDRRANTFAFDITQNWQNTQRNPSERVLRNR